MPSRNYFQPFRLSEAARRQLLDRLDANSAATRRSPSRKTPRYTFRQPNLPLLVSHPGGSIGRFLVYARNLSAGGMSFLHGGFLHLGTRLAVTMTDRRGESHIVIGEIVNTRFIINMLHEVNVAFESEIDPTQFHVGNPDKADTITENKDSESVSLPELEGSIVCVGDRSVELTQIASVLRATGLTVDECDTLGSTLDRIKTGRLDLLLAEPRVDGVPFSKLVTRARAETYRGPIMGLLREGAPPEVPKGAIAAINHPLDAVLLLTLVDTEIRRRHGKLDTIRPAMPPESDLRSAAAFARWANDARTAIAHAVVSGERSELITVAERLLQGGRRHGYAPITDSATQLLDCCRSNDPDRSPRAEVVQLVRLCGAVAPPIDADEADTSARAA
ncbi:MAG: PilZ domain-containing protein [Planctomycetota bacterium]